MNNKNNSRNAKATKYITAAVVFIALSLCNVFFAAILHKIFSHAEDWMHFESFWNCVHIIASNKGALVMFGAIEIFIVLGLIAAQLSRTNTYKSDLVKITEDIYLPREAGEKQYGSARFYTKDEVNKIFTALTIDPSDAKIKELMAHGYDDVGFMKQSERRQL